jgi:hypothetical protein
MPELKHVIARFGADAKAKLANPGATGEPEDQLRAPLERLFADLAELCGFKREWLTSVGDPRCPTGSWGTREEKTRGRLDGCVAARMI